MSFPSSKGVPAAGYPHDSLVYREALITENGAGTYTAKIPIPAGASVLNVLVANQALWAAATSASLTAGDDVTANCFVAATDVKSTPAIDDTALQGTSSSSASSGKTKRYPDGGNVVVKVVSVGAGAAGKTTVGVVLACPFAPVTAVKS